VRRRWLPFAVAAAASLLMATLAGISANALLTGRAQPAPQLKNVPNATLARLGISLSAATQPPYCGATGPAVQHGLLRPGAIRCAISTDAAVAAARRGGGTQVVEALLALVSSSRSSTIGRDRLSWLLVTQGPLAPPGPGAFPCQTPGGGWTACAPVRTFNRSQLVVVDAYSGGVVSTLSLNPAAAGRTPGAHPSRAGPGAA
jgi:hypothetical protein